MPSVLFVCTANRFRSPLAAAIFIKILEKERNGTAESWIVRNSGDWRVGSAGTWAMSGEPVLPVVSDAARKLGVDLSEHRSERVNGQLLAEYDLILVMQASHKEALQIEFPSLSDRIYLLSHVVERGSYDIMDSLGSEQEVTDIVLEMITLIQNGSRYICVLATALHNKRNRAK